jgi:WD40 repeat protein
MSPDGQRALVNDDVDDVTLYDLSTGDLIATLAQDGVGYKALSYSPDGERVAVLEFDSDCWLYPSVTDCETAIGLFAADDLRPLDVAYESLSGGLELRPCSHPPVTCWPPLTFSASAGSHCGGPTSVTRSIA